MTIAALGALLRSPWVRRGLGALALALMLWAGWAWLSGTLRAQGARKAEAAAAERIERARLETARLAAELAATREHLARTQEIASAAARHADTLRRLDAAASEARRSLDVAAATLRAAAPPAAADAPPVGPDAVVDPALAGVLRGAVERLRLAARTGAGGGAAPPASPSPSAL